MSPTTTRHHGNKGSILLSKTGAGALAAVASLSKWTLNRTTQNVDVTCFGDPNKVYVQGIPDIKGTISGFWDTADDTLFAASESLDGAQLYLYPSTLFPSAWWAGPALIDANIDVGASGAVILQGTFAASGAWSRAHY